MEQWSASIRYGTYSVWLIALALSLLGQRPWQGISLFLIRMSMLAFICFLVFDELANKKVALSVSLTLSVILVGLWIVPFF